MAKAKEKDGNKEIESLPKSAVKPPASAVGRFRN